MQLETGRSSAGLVGTLRNIVREEGCVGHVVTRRPPLTVDWTLQCRTSLPRYGYFLPVASQGLYGFAGLVPPLLLEAPKRATKFAANDYWGKTFMKLTGQSKMNQELAILTGSSAGATESFVVVPFELVKIK